jgi:hypothetical protein
MIRASPLVAGRSAGQFGTAPIWVRFTVKLYSKLPLYKLS